MRDRTVLVVKFPLVGSIRGIGMSTAKVSRFLALLAVSAIGGAFFPDVSLGQTAFQYPPYGALRGRMVSRDGVFRAQRYRWGNGITPQGAAFLTSAVNAVVPMIPTLITGRTSSSDDYTDAQKEANSLLKRTERLLSRGAGDIAPDADASMAELGRATALLQEKADAARASAAAAERQREALLQQILNQKETLLNRIDELHSKVRALK
jgi:hypothetical protein